MSLDEQQAELNAKYEALKRRKRGQFVIGPKSASFGARGRRAVSEGVEFKKLWRTKNKNPRYKAELRLGAE